MTLHKRYPNASQRHISVRRGFFPPMFISYFIRNVVWFKITICRIWANWQSSVNISLKTKLATTMLSLGAFGLCGCLAPHAVRVDSESTPIIFRPRDPKTLWGTALDSPPPLLFDPLPESHPYRSRHEKWALRFTEQGPVPAASAQMIRVTGLTRSLGMRQFSSTNYPLEYLREEIGQRAYSLFDITIGDGSRVVLSDAHRYGGKARSTVVLTCSINDQFPTHGRVGIRCEAQFPYSKNKKSHGTREGMITLAYVADGEVVGFGMGDSEHHRFDGQGIWQDLSNDCREAGCFCRWTSRNSDAQISEEVKKRGFGKNARHYHVV
jgi:hypothetical protein